MEEQKEFYRWLGVPRTAQTKEIVDAYRALAMKWHPDRHHTPSEKNAAAVKFKKISEAYQNLKDPVKRAAFDALSAEPIPRYGPGEYRRWREAAAQNLPKGDTISIELPISISIAISGGNIRVEPYRDLICSECRGDGFDHNDHRCDICRGDGYVLDHNSAFTLRVRPGVVTGSILVARNRGKSELSGGEPGDLHIKIRVSSEPSWLVSGINIHGDIKIPFSVALLGGDVDVIMPGDKVLRVSIPAHTDSGARLKIEGHGLHDSRNHMRGDAYVRVSIVLPNSPKHVTWSAERTIRELYNG